MAQPPTSMHRPVGAMLYVSQARALTHIQSDRRRICPSRSSASNLVFKASVERAMSQRPGRHPHDVSANAKQFAYVIIVSMMSATADTRTQIGINYYGQGDSQLSGCVNDARNMQRFLISEL